LLGKCLALSSANRSRLNAPEQRGVKPSAWRDRQEPCRRVGLGEDSWLGVKNGGSNRISEVWDYHVCVLSLYCMIRCDRRCLSAVELARESLRLCMTPRPRRVRLEAFLCG
jgi:hypothetical protein